MEHNAINLMDWLKSTKSIYQAEINGWTYCAVRVPYTDTIDLLFGNYTYKSGVIQMNKLEPLGFYLKQKSKVWMNGNLEYWFWNREQPDSYDAEEVLDEMRTKYQKALVQQLMSNEEWLVRANAAKCEEALNDYKIYRLHSLGYEAYLLGEVKPIVTTNQMTFDMEIILQYLENPDNFMSYYTHEKILEDQVLYACLLLQNHMLCEYVCNLEKEPPERLRLYKQIRDAIKESGAVNVHLTLENIHGERMQIAYPVREMCRTNGDLVYSGYELTAKERKKLEKFKLVNGDIPWFEKSNIVPEDIVLITYKKKTLYESSR